MASGITAEALNQGLVEDAEEPKLVLPNDLFALYLRSSRPYGIVSSLVNTWISGRAADDKDATPTLLRRVAKSNQALTDWKVRLLIFPFDDSC